MKKHTSIPAYAGMTWLLTTGMTLLLAIGLCISAPAFAEKASSAEKDQQAADAAQKFIETGRYSEALKLYEYLSKHYPKEATIFYNMGIAQYLLGKPADAAKSYEQSLKIRPNDAQTLANLGLTYDALGRKDEALNAYEQSLLYDPTSPSVRLKLAGFYEAHGDLEKADAAYRKMADVDPKFAEGRYWYGKSLAARGRYDEAWKEIHAAQDLFYPGVEPRFLEELRAKSPEPAYQQPVPYDAETQKKLKEDWDATDREMKKKIEAIKAGSDRKGSGEKS